MANPDEKIEDTIGLALGKGTMLLDEIKCRVLVTSNVEETTRLHLTHGTSVTFLPLA